MMQMVSLKGVFAALLTTCALTNASADSYSTGSGCFISSIIFMRCYRYLGLGNGLEAVRSGFLKGSCPVAFNDPFDSVGYFSGQLTGVALDEFYESHKDEIRQIVIADTGLHEDEVDECKIRDLFARKYLQLLNKSAMRRNGISHHYAFLCFAGQGHKDALMWGHYGDSGRGMRIEIETDLLPNRYLVDLVTYKPTIPVCNLGECPRLQNDDKIREFIRRCLWTKGLEWADEKEIRVIVERDDAEACEERFDGRAMLSPFVRIPHASMKSICFGPDADMGVIKTGIKVLSRVPELQDMKIIRAKRDGSQYKYKYEPLT